VRFNLDFVKPMIRRCVYMHVRYRAGGLVSKLAYR